jgi:nitrite reductase/ring-hydroxylating ferredoxin subunit
MMVTTDEKPWRRPFSGYHQPRDLREELALTHTDPGTPCGELMRRFWQPIALASELGERPLALTILGEKLVLFRDQGGRLGLFHRHCAHRGTSLEWGIPMARGLRCCYHGWAYDIDGRCLETPGEPPHSQLKGSVVQGAYPVREVDKLIFAYMGPPDEQPEMPVWDTQTQPDSEVDPFSIVFDCNWLQTHENGIDPIHAVFLHARPGRDTFGDVFYTLPRLDIVETPYGACVQTTRRTGDHIWTRMVDLALPNVAHIPVPWVDANQEQFYTHAGVLRWCVPIDNTHNLFIGWRYFNERNDPKKIGDPARCGKNMVDFPGQERERSYRERQIEPGDYEAQVGQGPIAVHDAENLGTTDKGVITLRRLLRRAVHELADGNLVDRPQPRSADGSIGTQSHDTVVLAPPGSYDGSDDDHVAAVAEITRDMAIETANLAHAKRAEIFEQKVRGVLATIGDV